MDDCVRPQLDSQRRDHGIHLPGKQSLAAKTAETGQVGNWGQIRYPHFRIRFRRSFPFRTSSENTPSRRPFFRRSASNGSPTSWHLVRVFTFPTHDARISRTQSRSPSDFARRVWNLYHTSLLAESKAFPYLTPI